MGVLDVLQRTISGTLMLISAAGLGALGYGVYSFTVLRPAAVRQLAAERAAAADGSTSGAAPTTPSRPLG